jgi:hypothetical protein
MDGDGQFDYRTLTKTQIEYALDHINASTYPLNFANARAALEARNSGASPEPPPTLDAETDAKYTNRAEKLLGALIALYAAIALVFDDLMIPYYSRSFNMSAIHLHGLAAWIGALALILFAAIPFFGGLDDSNRLEVMPRFKYIYVIAILLAVVAVAISYLGPERLANACAILGCTVGLGK